MGEIKYPITVTGIKFQGKDTYQPNRYGKKVCGKYVAVRPCGEQYGNKTYLGIMLGEIALTQGITFDPKTGELTVMRYMHNPAMFVPELNEVIFGCGSFWKTIKNPEQLKQITDADINNLWYMKALKDLAEEDQSS